MRLRAARPRSLPFRRRRPRGPARTTRGRLLLLVRLAARLGVSLASPVRSSARRTIKVRSGRLLGGATCELTDRVAELASRLLQLAGDLLGKVSDHRRQSPPACLKSAGNRGHGARANHAGLSDRGPVGMLPAHRDPENLALLREAPRHRAHVGPPSVLALERSGADRFRRARATRHSMSSPGAKRLTTRIVDMPFIRGACLNASGPAVAGCTRCPASAPPAGEPREGPQHSAQETGDERPHRLEQLHDEQ